MSKRSPAAPAKAEDEVFLAVVSVEVVGDPAASVARRLAAAVVDAGLLGSVFLAVAFVGGPPHVAFYGLSIVGYLAGLPWLAGSTFGMAALRLRLVAASGWRYGLTSDGAWWMFARVVLGLPLAVISALVALIRRRRLAHDGVFRGRVVVSSDLEGGPLQRVWALHERVAENLEARQPPAPAVRLFRWLFDRAGEVDLIVNLLGRLRRHSAGSQTITGRSIARRIIVGAGLVGAGAAVTMFLLPWFRGPGPDVEPGRDQPAISRPHGGGQVTVTTGTDPTTTLGPTTPGTDPAGGPGTTYPGPPSRPRWGIGYAGYDKQYQDSSGTEKALWSTYTWTTPTTPKPATVVHTGTGVYTVQMPGIGTRNGIPHVSAYTTDNTGRSCSVAGYGPTESDDELVQVRCFDHTGALADWRFLVYFGATAEVGPTQRATVRYDGTGSPNPVSNASTSNSEGGQNRVRRLSPGRYEVTLEGAAYASDNGYAQVTPFGAGATTCLAEKTESRGAGLAITVACQRISIENSLQPVDSAWLLSYVQGVGLSGEASAPAAYLTTFGDPANPSIDALRSFTTGESEPTLVKVGRGRYQITYADLGGQPDQVQVMSRDPYAYCHVNVVNSYFAPPKLTIEIYCTSRDGMLHDSNFGLAYLRGPDP